MKQTYFDKFPVVNRGEFRVNIGYVFNNQKDNFTIIGRHKDIRNKKWYFFECNTCGWKNGKIEEYNLLSGKGCGCCNGKKVIVGINDIGTTSPWMVDYFQNGYEEAKKYTFRSSKKLNFKCPDCNKIKNKKIPIYTLYVEHSIGCDCKDNKSYPEKFMASILNQLSLSYIWGYSPDWLRGYNGSKNPAQFDFYIPTKSLIIEMDGGIGHGKYVLSNYDKTIEETLEKDIWKDNKAYLYGISVIRINCDKSTLQHLKFNIKNSLNNIFDLTNINWDKADADATKNILKEVCEYFKKENCAIKDLIKIFDLSKSAITKYLHKGTALGWCSYSGDIEIQKNINNLKERNSLRLSKPLSVYYNGSLLKSYSSAKECVKNSEKDIGVPFLLTGVCKAARENKLYKGHSFIYTTNINII